MQPQRTERQLERQAKKHEARRRQARFRNLRAGRGAWAAVLLTIALGSLSTTAIADATPVANGNSVNQVVVLEPARSGNPPSAPTSAQDLSLFGVLALGIIGLLWVRRHTSEL